MLGVECADNVLFGSKVCTGPSLPGSNMTLHMRRHMSVQVMSCLAQSDAQHPTPCGLDD